MTNAPSLTRELVNRLPERVDERGPMLMEDPTEEYYQNTATQILSQLHKPKELWVFAIGSLIWNPRCNIIDRQKGLVKGWGRSFCLGPDERYRGNPTAPGCMLSLDKGGECWGIALRMSSDDLMSSLVALLKSEPPCPPVWVNVETKNGTLPAIAFTADPQSLLYQAEPPEAELADTLSSAVGHVGSMADYVLNTIIELEKAGIHDPHLWRMQELIAERLEKLP